jgi:hypothetical protein
MYSKQDIIKSIQILANDLGKTPSLGDYRDYKCKPTDPVIINRFGSWNAALAEAGFTEHYYLSKEQLLGLLQDFYKEHNKTPSTRDFNSSNYYPNSITYKRNFGSWNTALELAGLPIKQRKPKVPYNKEYVVSSIKEYISKYKKIPTQKEFDADKTFPSATTVVKYCGSWENAIVEAGYTPDIGSGFGHYTKALDGHTYRSKAEAYFVDTYLFSKYTYDIEPSYHKPEQRRKYDWYIKELAIYIELDGGCRPNIVLEKRSINKHININCAIIPIKNIYLNKTLIELIEEFKT